MKTRLSDIERQRIRVALVEDAGKGDPTTEATVPEELLGSATFLAKESGILAGIDIARQTFEIFEEQTNVRSPIFEYCGRVDDGERVVAGDVLAVVRARMRTLLTAERVALNLLQRMSGIATLTRKFVDAVEGTGATILDTRKTAPLLRPFDRYAVRAGGATNHRYSLGEMILVKDNHIAACGGGLPMVLERLELYFGLAGIERLPVEIEVTTLDQLRELLAIGRPTVNRVLLDNFTLPELTAAVEMNARVFETEASGGVKLVTVRDIAHTGVDFISVGALTHSAGGLDISLEIEEERP